MSTTSYKTQKNAGVPARDPCASVTGNPYKAVKCSTVSNDQRKAKGRNMAKIANQGKV